jgi:hypothetical protein
MPSEMEATTQHGYLVLRPPQQVRQLGDIGRNAPGFILGHEIGRADRRPGSSSDLQAAMSVAQTVSRI